MNKKITRLKSPAASYGVSKDNMFCHSVLDTESRKAGESHVCNIYCKVYKLNPGNLNAEIISEKDI